MVPPRSPSIVIHLHDAASRLLSVVDQHMGSDPQPAAVLWAQVERAVLELQRLAEGPERSLHAACDEAKRKGR